MPSPTCLLCLGKDCRTAKGFAPLRRALEAAGVQVSPVRCQGVCKGPVVGFRARDDTLRWYKRVRGADRRRALLDALKRRVRPEGLEKREVRKRRGKLKGKAPG